MPLDPTPLEIDAAMKTLAWLVANPVDVDDPLGEVLARAYKRIRKHRRIVAARARPAPAGSDVISCYICGRAFAAHGGGYPLLCGERAEDQTLRRHHRGDLRGRTAVITGARIKVGFQTALKFLRDGARVIATTRFPADCAARYAAESDFLDWHKRLTIHAIDLCDPRAIHAFTDHLQQTAGSLDILVNNAAQTIRRPPEFYAQLSAHESQTRAALPSATRALIADPTALTALAPPRHQRPPREAMQPFAADFQHTWLLPLEEVDSVELAEVMVINAMAPFILCSQLEPLLRRSRFADRYIVNVTSIEGQFARDAKSPRHPHTNMAKAALNMLTRTAAGRCAEAGIYMNSVDPGWITHMPGVDPAAVDDENANFTPPLDSVDGAARIYDPILRGMQGQPAYGLLLKDYHSISW